MPVSIERLASVCVCVSGCQCLCLCLSWCLCQCLCLCISRNRIGSNLPSQACCQGRATRLTATMASTPVASSGTASEVLPSVLPEVLPPLPPPPYSPDDDLVAGVKCWLRRASCKKLYHQLGKLLKHVRDQHPKAGQATSIAGSYLVIQGQKDIYADRVRITKPTGSLETDVVVRNQLGVSYVSQVVSVSGRQWVPCLAMLGNTGVIQVEPAVVMPVEIKPRGSKRARLA